MQMYAFGFWPLFEDFVKGIRRSQKLRHCGSLLSTHYDYLNTQTEPQKRYDLWGLG